MNIQKIYGNREYLIDEACVAYWNGENYNLYEGNDFDSARNKLKGSVAGEDYNYIHRFEYIPIYEKPFWGSMDGYIWPVDGKEGDYKVIRCFKGNEGLIHSEIIAYLEAGDVTFNKRNYRGFDILIWRPEYSGWSWCAFADTIPGAAGAYALLMADDYRYRLPNELYFEGRRWQVGMKKPDIAPPLGTHFTWEWDEDEYNKQ